MDFTGLGMTSKGKSEKQKRLLVTTAMVLVVLTALLVVGGWYLLEESRQGESSRRIGPIPELELKRIAFPNVRPDAKAAFDITGFHDHVMSEWWYFNAHLVAEGNRLYTLVITFLKPNRIYGIFSMVDDEINNPINIVVPITFDPGKQVMKAGRFVLAHPNPNLFCYDFGAALPSATIRLELCANKSPLLVGGEGVISMGLNGKSRYFSLTDMNVQGVVKTGGREVAVKGKAWLDRQWGNWENNDFDQWKWVSIQLFNGMEIMVFKFTLKGRSVSPLCDIVWPDGTREHNARYNLEVTDNWVSPKTGVSWSSGWKLTIPAHKLELNVTPDFADHEVTEALWEGGCEVEGLIDGNPVKGRAFYEERRRTWDDRKRELMWQGDLN
jgi:predicted secreted hydrolase